MLAALILSLLTNLAQAGSVPGEVIVKLKSSATAEALVPKALAASVRSFRFFETDRRFAKVTLQSEKAKHSYLTALRDDPRVEYAEPNYLMHALGAEPEEKLPDDPEFSKQWALKNTGQNGGLPGADISATKAWAYTTGSKAVLVAVIDTGIDHQHPDLKENIYTNPGEIAGNGIDDDHNGFIDDVHGWNFSDNSANSIDDNGHGTHVAGVIGAHGDNALGVSGVNWQVSLLPVKFLDAYGSGTLENALKAVQYATLMHAQVMNNSWGGGEFSQAMFDTIKAAGGQGSIFVAAAGGSGQDMDGSPNFPAGYQLENVVAVAASTNRDTLAYHSSFGRNSVHIAAPGNLILSTVPGGKYETYSGSSFSAAFFSGAAALLWSSNPALTMQEARERLLRSRDPKPEFAGKLTSGGRLNVYNAIMGIYPSQAAF